MPATPPPTRRQSGIAVVSALVILLALTAFGLSSVFLTQMNLGIARNAQATVRADNNAASGLNVAFVRLQDEYRVTGELPASLTLPTITGQGFAPTYALTHYVRYSTTTAYVAVAGTAPGQGEYLAEAVVSVQGNSGLPPYFGYGLSTEGVFEASGNAWYVNAGVHANKGFKFSGNQHFRTCVERNANGTCGRDEVVPSDSLAVSASPGATVCAVSGNGIPKSAICADGGPRHLTDPITIDPEFGARQVELMQSISKGPSHSHVLGIDCDVIFRSAPKSRDLPDAFASVPAGSTICVESGAVKISGNWSIAERTVVARDNIDFSGNWSMRDMTLVSTTGSISGSGNSPMANVRVFGRDGVKFSGNHDVTGISTFASGGDVQLSGNAHAVAAPGGGSGIGTAIIAGGDIKISGNSRLYIAAVAGGSFHKSGNADYVGRVASKGNLKISGNFDIDSGVAIVTDQFVVQGDATLRVMSRR